VTEIKAEKKLGQSTTEENAPSSHQLLYIFIFIYKIFICIYSITVMRTYWQKSNWPSG